MEPAGIRSGTLAAAGQVLSGIGFGHSHPRLRSRHRHNLQALWPAHRDDRHPPDRKQRFWQHSHRSFHLWHRFCNPVPGTDQVTIKYNTVNTQEAQGSLNDQKIQQLLLYAARNNYNSGVRVDSVDLLAQRSSEMQVREALIYALQNDTNPGVRLKSLDALGTYVKSDTNVRDAILRALVNDTNSGVRIEALRLIEPVKADGSVRGVLMALAAKDTSTYIKSQARTMLAQLPEID